MQRRRLTTPIIRNGSDNAINENAPSKYTGIGTVVSTPGVASTPVAQELLCQKWLDRTLATTLQLLVKFQNTNT